MYFSCDTKKFHDNESTHILHNFWTSTHRGGSSPWRRHCALPTNPTGPVVSRHGQIASRIVSYRSHGRDCIGTTEHVRPLRAIIIPLNFTHLNVLGIALKRFALLVFLFVIFSCVVERVPSNCFIQRFTAAASVLVGPCCPALLGCIDVDTHTVVLLGR